MRWTRLERYVMWLSLLAFVLCALAAATAWMGIR